jgi:flagellar hook-length control protein FliK
MSALPVIPSPPRDTAALAEGLKLALTQSGVFYESHQAQWVAGQRPLEEVMREPQACLKPAGEPIHPQTIGLVRQQLEILDTRQLVWQGQVWPEQSMEWRVEEDRPGGNAADDLPVWRTSLRLTLPRLGEVTATLAIQGDELRLAFTGLAQDARTAVIDGQTTLRDALAKAGLALLQMKVDRDEA